MADEEMLLRRTDIEDDHLAGLCLPGATGLPRGQVELEAGLLALLRRLAPPGNPKPIRPIAAAVAQAKEAELKPRCLPVDFDG